MHAFSSVPFALVVEEVERGLGAYGETLGGARSNLHQRSEEVERALGAHGGFLLVDEPSYHLVLRAHLRDALLRALRPHLRAPRRPG